MRISDWSSDVCSSDLIEARWLYRQEAVRILEEPEIGCEGVFRADQRAQAIEDRAFGGVAAEHIVERLFDVAALPAIVARLEQGAVIAIGMTISVLAEYKLVGEVNEVVLAFARGGPRFH